MFILCVSKYITEHGYRIPLYHFLYLDDLVLTILSCLPVYHMTPQLAALTIWRWIDVLPGRCVAAMGGQLCWLLRTPTPLHRMGRGSDHTCICCYSLQSIQYKSSVNASKCPSNSAPSCWKVSSYDSARQGHYILFIAVHHYKVSVVHTDK